MKGGRPSGRDRPASYSVFEAGSHHDPFQLLTAEHALIRLTLARAVEEARTDPSGAGARDALVAFIDGFELHQRREDVVVYPLCERLFGGKDGVACVLRDDHLAIRDTLDGIRVASGRNGSVAAPELVHLHALLEAHFVKEERVLFPQITARIPGRETATLARRLRAAGPS